MIDGMIGTFGRIVRSRYFWLGLILFLGALYLWDRGLINPRRPTETVIEMGEKAANLVSRGDGFSFNKDTSGYENLEKLDQGCPFRDCIPSIDEPKFESVSKADEWMNDQDVVFGLEYEGQNKAYPQKILNWHEIVNDEVAGDPIAVTFCPLCGSALAFDRSLELGDSSYMVLELGVSGKLHNSDLVMYDRQTETLWQQITGEAIVGELFGMELRKISLSSMRWEAWKSENSDSLVLSRDTGYSRNYHRYPYGDYEQSESVSFPVLGGVDEVLHPKKVVYGIEVGGEQKAYTREALEKDEDGVIDDRLGGRKIRISYDAGEVEVEDLDKGEEIVAVRLFWFAWKAFHPQTELYIR